MSIHDEGLGGLLADYDAASQKKVKPAMSNKWEKVSGGSVFSCERMAVYGGWIVVTCAAGADFMQTVLANSAPPVPTESVSTVYVPDPNHEWKLEDEAS